MDTLVKAPEPDLFNDEVDAQPIENFLYRACMGRRGCGSLVLQTEAGRRKHTNLHDALEAALPR